MGTLGKLGGCFHLRVVHNPQTGEVRTTPPPSEGCETPPPEGFKVVRLKPPKRVVDTAVDDTPHKEGNVNRFAELAKSETPLFGEGHDYADEGVAKLMQAIFYCPSCGEKLVRCCPPRRKGTLLGTVRCVNDCTQPLEDLEAHKRGNTPRKEG